MTAARWLRASLVLVVTGGSLGMIFAARDVAQAAGRKPLASAAANLEIARLTAELDQVKGNLVVNELKLDRMAKVAQYSTRYQIPDNVAGRIYDAAVAEGIQPALGYQLVKVESQFRPGARSSSGALGYTQVLPATARTYDPSVTDRGLLDPDLNLRIGFRILKRLLVQFDHDLELALRAYNLGPTGAIQSLTDTATAAIGAAYAGKVMRGVKRAN
jgi:soluble lytic murein transglycosylase-like protein